MIDWKSLFTDLNVPYWDEGKNCSPGRINIQCPFCSDHSNHGSFGIAKGDYQCWRCKGGHPVKAVSLAAHIPMDTARQLIQKYSKGLNPFLQAEQTHKSNVKSITLPGEPLKECHRRYLSEVRKFDPEELEFYHGILGTTDIGYWQGIDFRFRVIIPVYDVWGNLCTFQGRDYTGMQDLRYKCCPVDKAVVHHKHLLYGAELARNKDRIVVVEGVFDQWRMGPGSVATFGTSLTREQVNLISMWKEVVFLFDPEPEARNTPVNTPGIFQPVAAPLKCVLPNLGLTLKGTPVTLATLRPTKPAAL